MNRSHQLVVVSHCLLNANAKVRPLATYKGVLMPAVSRFIEDGCGLFQLPCAESSYLGINRWGMSKDQYDHPRYRRHCRDLLTPVLDQLEAFTVAGVTIRGVIGVDGSPNCGVHKTPMGLPGGVFRCMEAGDDPFGDLSFVPAPGIYMELLKEMLAERKLSLPFAAVDEANPSTLIGEEF